MRDSDRAPSFLTHWIAGVGLKTDAECHTIHTKDYGNEGEFCLYILNPEVRDNPTSSLHARHEGHPHSQALWNALELQLLATEGQVGAVGIRGKQQVRSPVSHY